MLSRKFGKILRGDATPFQLFGACLLASLVAFVPGVTQGPGLLLVYVLLIILLNVNLLVGVLMGALAKLAALALTPVSFEVGHWLMDGPARGFFQTIINAPVLAYFGLDYYVTTGGVILGLLFGAVSGALLVSLVNAFRRKIAHLEKNSEKYQAFVKKGWVKCFLFIFVSGGLGKKSYEEVLNKRVGNPIRPLGVVFAACFLALVSIVTMFASGPVVAFALQTGMERANGATVDLESADLSLTENRLVMNYLAVADPEALETDLFRASRIEANISGADLLRKRVSIERVVVSEGASGLKRQRSGELIRPVSDEPEVEEAPPVEDQPGKTIEDYVQQAKEWRQRLEQVEDWLEKVSGSDEETPDAEDGAPGDQKESLEERLRRQVREKGYANVRASHLIEQSPALTIHELMAERVTVAQLPGETVDVLAKHLSTHPSLLPEKPEISIRSSKETFGFQAVLAGMANSDAESALDFYYRNLAADEVLKNLRISGEPPLRGGTMDLAAKGMWRRGAGIEVDFPLEVTLRNSTVSLPQGKSAVLDQFSFPIGVTGPLANPRVDFDAKSFMDQLAKAGMNEALEQAKTEAKDRLLKEVDEKLGDKLGGALGEKAGGAQPEQLKEQSKSLLNRFLGGDKKEQDE